MEKYSNENYIQSIGHPINMKTHSNVMIMNEYSDYINGKVLDIGCNNGNGTYWLKGLNVSEIVGVDLNNEALLDANVYFKEVNIPYRFICKNYVDSNLNELFDTIISFHTLEHIYEEDINSFLTNIYDDLKEGGYFLITIPYDRNYYDTHHNSFYTENSLISIIESIGFTTIECYKNDKYNEKNLLTGLFKK
jgi:2-polyprenyl-3-methyl-5-hydroxy-6-metoxy-1,4-benzoquinol methylase